MRKKQNTSLAAFAPKRLNQDGVVTIDDVLPPPVQPTVLKALPSASGSIQPWTAPAVMRHGPSAISKKPFDPINVIPANKKLLAPPVIVDVRMLMSFLSALRHLTMSKDRARTDRRIAFTGIRIAYNEGQLTLTVSSGDDVGIATMPARSTQQVPPWAMIVSPDPLIRSLGDIKAEIEIAPGERLHVGKFAFPLCGEATNFPAMPPDPVEVAFEVIINRNDLRQVVKKIHPIIIPDAHRVGLRNYFFDPIGKFVAATDAHQARFMKLDIRARARMTNPEPFTPPQHIVRAAAVLEPGEFIMMTVSKKKEIFVGGPGSDYRLYSDGTNQHDVLQFRDILIEPQNEFTFKKKEFIEVLNGAKAIHDEEIAPTVYLHFMDKQLILMTSTKEIDGPKLDYHREIPYLGSKMETMISRQSRRSLKMLVSACNIVDDENLVIGFPKNAGAADYLYIYGPSKGIITIIAAILDTKENE